MMSYKKNFIRQVGGVSGDTRIPLTDNRNLNIIEIINEYNLGKENYVFSLNSSYYEL